jgi:hypothetical protein
MADYSMENPLIPYPPQSSSTVKLGAKYNGKNPQGRPIGHTTETATKNKILIACNPDFSTASSASLEMTERIRAQDSNSGASSTPWF